MSENIELIKSTDKIEQIYKMTSKFQEKQNQLEKEGNDHRASKDAELKQLSDEVGKLMQSKQDDEVFAEKLKEQETQIRALEAELKRAPLGVKSNVKEIDSKYNSAFKSYIKQGVNISEDMYSEYHSAITEDLYGEKNSKTEFSSKALATDVGPDGGYLIVPERLNQTITRDFETDPMQQLATVVNTTSTSIEMIIDDEEVEDVEKPSEREPRSPGKTPQIGLKEIHTHEIYKSQPVTTKMLDSFPGIEQWILGKLDRKFTREKNKLAVRGSGSSEARGFLGYDAWSQNEVYEKGKLEHINSGTDGAVEADTLIQCQNALHEAYQGNAVWLAKRATFTDIMQLKDNENRYLFDMNSMLKTGTDKVLLGKRLLFSNSMDSVATDAKAIAYGDFRQGYTIVNQIGMRILRDPYTNKPFVLFDAYQRFGGDVTSYDSLKIYQLSN